jgi:hypothetical protein
VTGVAEFMRLRRLGQRKRPFDDRSELPAVTRSAIAVMSAWSASTSSSSVAGLLDVPAG